MRKIIIFGLLAAVAFPACQQKEQSAPQFQPPVGQPGQGSGPVGGGPIQGLDQAKMLREAVTKDPKNLDAWIKLGNTLMDTRRFSEAVEAYGKALELDPRNPDVRVDMGTCLRESGKPDMAVKEYRKAIEYSPNHMNAHKNMGVVLAYDLKDYKQAIKVFEKVLAIAPNAPDAPAIKAEIEKMKSMTK